MNSRQKKISEALSVIGVEKLTNFIQDQRTQASRVMALMLLKMELDEGRELEKILFKSNKIFNDSEEFGYNLTVVPISINCYRISLGCLAGPLTGDSGEWEVTFDEDVKSQISQAVLHGLHNSFFKSQVDNNRNLMNKQAIGET